MFLIHDTLYPQDDPLMSTPAPTAVDLSKAIPLTDPAKALLAPALAPRPFLDLLIAKKHYADAALFMAHAMPKREAVWWGCQCARLAYGVPRPALAQALEACEKWAAKPSDEQRRLAFKLAEGIEFNNPAGLLGMAVFFSGGSLTPAQFAPVPPAEHLTGNAVGNSVTLSALMQGALKAPAQYLTFFPLGFDVAAGKNRWKEK